jgi:hypothetical protein
VNQLSVPPKIRPIEHIFIRESAHKFLAAEEASACQDQVKPELIPFLLERNR